MARDLSASNVLSPGPFPPEHIQVLYVAVCWDDEVPEVLWGVKMTVEKVMLFCSEARQAVT